MRDIIERLRERRLDSECIDPDSYCCGSDCECQLEDIEEAAADIERLREALREIVKHSDYDDPVRDMALAALGEKE